MLPFYITRGFIPFPCSGNNMQENSEQDAPLSWRHKLHEIIFEADTAAGKLFDVVLILSILLSIVAVMLDSVVDIRRQYGDILVTVEWFFTILFTVEYFLRLASIGRPLKYAFSFYGLVDLLSIIPTYFSLIFPASKYLLVIRILRVLRVFRVLKLVQYLKEANLLLNALRSSMRKITVFLFTVLTLVVIFGSLMYIVEGEDSGFTSIPRGVYWAIVTMTTVGYGDISPATSLGQGLASMIMIIGYGIIAVPTGIVTVEMSQAWRSKQVSTKSCPECSSEGHDHDAAYCKFCGSSL